MYKKLDRKPHVTLTSENDYTNMLMDVNYYSMKEGEKLSFYSSNKEIALLLLIGELEILEPVKESFKRENVFNQSPNLIHVSKNIAIVVMAKVETEILVQMATNENDFKTVIYKDVATQELGSPQFNGRDQRLIRTIFDYSNAPYSNLVVGEVITLPGNWSSYVPHSHKQPEVYYYKMDHENGFGATFVGDDVYKIEDHSFVAIPGDLVHPQVVAPGYTMYYCWIIRHLENDPWTDRVIDPKHMHLVEEKK